MDKKIAAKSTNVRDFCVLCIVTLRGVINFQGKRHFTAYFWSSVRQTLSTVLAATKTTDHNLLGTKHLLAPWLATDNMQPQYLTFNFVFGQVDRCAVGEDVGDGADAPVHQGGGDWVHRHGCDLWVPPAPSSCRNVSREDRNFPRVRNLCFCPRKMCKRCLTSLHSFILLQKQYPDPFVKSAEAYKMRTYMHHI